MKHMYTLTDSHTHSYTFILSFIPHSYTQSRTHSYLCGYKVSQPRKKNAAPSGRLGYMKHTYTHTFIHIHTTFTHTFILTWIHKVS